MCKQCLSDCALSHKVINAQSEFDPPEHDTTTMVCDSLKQQQINGRDGFIYVGSEMRKYIYVPFLQQNI
jgi:hypothetical protein